MAADSGAPSATLPTDPVLRVLEREAEVREAGPDRVRGREVLPLPGVLAELHEEVQDPRERAVRVPARAGQQREDLVERAERPEGLSARALAHARVQGPVRGGHELVDRGDRLAGVEVVVHRLRERPQRGRPGRPEGGVARPRVPPRPPPRPPPPPPAPRGPPPPRRGGGGGRRPPPPAPTAPRPAGCPTRPGSAGTRPSPLRAPRGGSRSGSGSAREAGRTAAPPGL